MIHFNWEITPATLMNIPMLIILGRVYGDWRIIKNRIDLMWADYCDIHGISDGNPHMHKRKTDDK